VHQDSPSNRSLAKVVRRRQTRLAAVVLCMTLLVGTALIVIRPAVRSSLRISEPGAFRTLTISGGNGEQSLTATAQLREFNIEETPDPTLLRPTRLELVVSISARRCRTVAARIHGTCGTKRPTPRSGYSLTVISSETSELKLSSAGMQKATLDGSGTSNALLRTAAFGPTIAKFTCQTPGASTRLIAQSLKTIALERHCGEGHSTDLRLLFVYDASPNLALFKLGRLTFTSPGAMASMITNQVTSETGSERRPAEQPATFPALVRSSLTSPHAFEFNSAFDASNSYIVLTTPAASSVRVARGGEQVPSLFGKYSAPLYALAGVIFGILLSMIVELLTRREAT
jgi:hypothetical protein